MGSDTASRYRILSFFRELPQRSATDKHLFLVVGIIIVNLVVLLAIKQVLIPSEYARRSLSLVHLHHIIRVLLYYILFWGIFIIAGFVMKAVRRDIMAVIYLFCFLTYVNYLHIALFTGLQVYVTPILFIHNNAVMILFFGTRIGGVLVAFSLAAYLGTTVLQQIGIMGVFRIIPEGADFYQVFHDPTFSFLFSLLFCIFVVISSLLVLHVVGLSNRQTDQIKSLSDKLGLYLPRILVRLLQEGQTDPDTVHYRKRLTVFISDIKDFTRISELLQPEETSKILNLYLTRMWCIAEEYGGTVDKFIGDAILIYFGGAYDEDHKENALKAVHMALAMQEEMKDIRKRLEKDGYDFPLRIRAGINTGYVTIGSFGAEKRMDYTVIGKEVNVASRLESICEPDQVLVSSATYNLTRDRIEYEHQGEIKVKGLQTALNVYRVLGKR